MPNPRSDRKFILRNGFILVAVFFTLRCTPPPVPHQCPPPPWTRYSSFTPDQVKGEALRLESMLARGDTALGDSGAAAGEKRLSGREIRRRLFELAIHHANPDFDAAAISRYAQLLCRNAGPDSVRYLNWGRAAGAQRAVARMRDSLAAAVAEISEGEKKESRSSEKLKKELKVTLRQIDSLTTVIAAQQETIAKLQKVDVMMEQHRNKIH